MNKLIIALGLVLFSQVEPALAQPFVVATEETFCINGLGAIGGYISAGLGVVVVLASALANTLSKQSFIGKIIHFLALNLTVDKVKKE
jgi:hypothetical protein